MCTLYADCENYDASSPEPLEKTSGMWLSTLLTILVLRVKYQFKLNLKLQYE